MSPNDFLMEPSLHTMAGYGFIAGLVLTIVAAFLWRMSSGGGTHSGAMFLDRALEGGIILTMLSAVVWWVTRT